MQRLEDWETRLLAEIDAARFRDFAYGQHDCALFAAGCVDAMCGTTLAETLRAAYHDEASAEAYFTAQGGWGPAVDALVGADNRIPWQFAQPGDIALVPIGLGDDCGMAIVNGHRALAATARGFAGRPISSAVTCWRIGRPA
jgi:hypothetical protein